MDAPNKLLRGEALNAALRSILWLNGHPTNVGAPQVGLPRFHWTTKHRWDGAWPVGGLPYGWWYLQDRSEVIFNRDYTPMFRVFPDGQVERADPGQFYEFIIQCWFYEDRNSPYNRGKQAKRLREILRAMADDLEERCASVALWELPE